MSVQTFIADDHEMVLDGLRLILETMGSYRVIGMATNGRDAVEGILKTRPHLAIIDMVMPGMNGTEVTREVRGHRCAAKILILSMKGDLGTVREAMAAGANGYMLKEAAGDDLLAALPALLAGRRVLSPSIREAMLEAQFAGSEGVPQSPSPRLSPREKEVLSLVVAGRTSAEISVQLGLSASTVDTYRSRIMTKLQVNSLAALIRFAIQHDIENSQSIAGHPISKQSP